ncbi:FkbM family methyltransferase [Rhodocista pekingensis]|uniref:FkbM family methyltransferase n=1 Tax=Rhodocista pekingensis TaxID=201185 RepID=A0ABW2KUX8_9PROT
MLGTLLRQVVPESAKLRLRARRGLTSGETELPLVPLLCDPDGTSVDVGANVGVYTWHIARASARTVAVEPNPGLAEKLQRGTGRTVEVLACALSDHEGTAHLAIPLTAAGELTSRATIEDRVNREFERRTVEVPLRTLDGLGLRDLGFLKVHAEGHEYPILEGGRQCIARDRPTILVGSEDRHVPGARQRIEAMLGSLGYRGFFLHEGRLHPLGRFRPEILQRPENAKRVGASYSDAYIHNFLFIHPDRPRVLFALAARLGAPTDPD